MCTRLFNHSNRIIRCHLSTKPINTNQYNQILAKFIISGELFTNPFISSKLLMWCDDISFASLLFKQIENPNIYAWNYMSRIYAHSEMPEKSVFVYNMMRRNGVVVPDNYSFPFVLKACSRLLVLDKGREVHLSSLKFGFEGDVFVQNCLISMYSVCGVVESARRVFDMVGVLDRDIVTWNSMISGYMQGEIWGEALRVFGDMLERNGVRPNDVSLVSALTACGRIGDFELGRKIHGFVVASGCVFDVFMGSSLIAMYAKCGHAEEALQVFRRLHQRNVVCWSSIIAGCAQSNLFVEAIGLFREMLVEGVKAEEATVASVVSACGHLGALDQGQWVHTYCERNGVQTSLAVSNAFIDMYTRCGDVVKAVEIFNELVEKDVFSWTVMISGLAMNGKSAEALELFSQMESSSEIRPNEITFLGVLTACSHSGLVNEGFYHFGSMTKTHNLIPRIEHFGCMVDLLGRADLLTEAERFVRTMPIEPDVVIWRSLLFCSRTNSNVELAELAAKRISEFESRKCGAQVLLSNVYAAASRWNDVKRVRKGMGSHGIRKQPGCSFVEINGVVHEFFVADTSHPQTDMIYDTVYGINHLLRFKGYNIGDALFEED